MQSHDFQKNLSNNHVLNYRLIRYEKTYDIT